MSKAQHTPGPWRPACRRGFAAVMSGLETNTVAVADCRTVDVDYATAEANAHLIAAAPDLLTACQAALAWHHDRSTGTWEGQVAILAAAVAKATGGTL